MTDVLCGNHCSRCPICRKNFRIWLSGKKLRRREKSHCFCCRASVLSSQGPVATGSFLHGAQPFYGSDDQSMRFTCTLLTHGRQVKHSVLLMNSLSAGADTVKSGRFGRWRCADLQARVEDAFGVKLHERTIGKYLAKHGFRRLSVRPEHPKTDPAAQQAFKKTLPAS